MTARDRTASLTRRVATAALIPLLGAAGVAQVAPPRPDHRTVPARSAYIGPGLRVTPAENTCLASAAHVTDAVACLDAQTLASPDLLDHLDLARWTPDGYGAELRSHPNAGDGPPTCTASAPGQPTRTWASPRPVADQQLTFFRCSD